MFLRLTWNLPSRTPSLQGLWICLSSHYIFHRLHGMRSLILSYLIFPPHHTELCNICMLYMLRYLLAQRCKIRKGFMYFTFSFLWKKTSLACISDLRLWMCESMRDNLYALPTERQFYLKILLLRPPRAHTGAEDSVVWCYAVPMPREKHFQKGKPACCLAQYHLSCLSPR